MIPERIAPFATTDENIDAFLDAGRKYSFIKE